MINNDLPLPSNLVSAHQENWLKELKYEIYERLCPYTLQKQKSQKLSNNAASLKIKRFYDPVGWNDVSETFEVRIRKTLWNL